MKVKMTQKLSANMEDYLEVIAVLKKTKGVARVKDISASLGVKKPSVVGALGVLSDKGLIIHERYGYVNLTTRGENLAKDIQNRHNTLIKFFTDILKINPKIAAKDACKIEHSISLEVFTKLTKFIEKMTKAKN